MLDEEEAHRQAVKQRVNAAVATGARDLTEILLQCEGADPRLILEFAGKDCGQQGFGPSVTTVSNPEVYVRLPAPDPFRSQWWFTGETVAYLVTQVNKVASSGPVVCLGAPTVGHALMQDRIDTLVLDVDAQVVSALQSIMGSHQAEPYDVADAIPPRHVGRFQTAILDPPWYEDVMRVFIGRALDTLCDGGDMFCTLPPRLTRPGIDRLRKQLINDLVSAGHEILGLEHARLSYSVPRFEQIALSGISEFRPIPWRRADLLHIRKASDSSKLSLL